MSKQTPTHYVSVSVSREVSGRISKRKMLPRNVFMSLFCFVLFMQNLFLPHQQLVIDSLVMDFGGCNLAEIKPHCRRFHPNWIFPRPAESWFEIHLHNVTMSHKL